VRSYSRRTIYEGLLSLSISARWLLRVLVNHSLGSGTHEGYVIMNPARLREQTQRIADRLKTLCNIMPPAGANVRQL
jgi:hypothetical protein